jgi:hypothetical protein
VPIFECFQSLPDYFEQQTFQQEYITSIQATKKHQLFSKHGFSLPSDLELLRYLCGFYCNNFVISNDELFPIGYGTFPIGALFNHSCYPNCIILYRNGQQIVKAINDIPPGKEICVSYCDGALLKEERRKLLKVQHFFDCVCEKCLAGEDPSLNNQLKTCSVTFDLHVEHEQWKEAVDYCKRIVELYKAIYPENHPMIGLQLFTLAKIQFEKLKKWEEALHSIKEAHSVLFVSQRELPIFKECEQLMQQIELELKKER